MKITKYNRKKDTSTTTTSSGGSIPINQSQNTSLESHTLWGQQFDGTDDVSGDINNAGNIDATGNITINGSTDNSGNVVGGNLKADSTITSNNIVSNNNVTSKTLSASESVTTNVVNSNSVTAKDSVTTKAVTSESVHTKDATIDNNLVTNNATVNNKLTSTNITNSDTIQTKNLEVTGKAHFFELEIDKIKSVGGQIILSGANAVVDLVSGNTLYWRCKDADGKQVSNDFIVNDQVICQTFNAATGTSYNVSNKYYWALVTAKGTTTLNGIDYHYIVLDSTTYDGTLNPSVGDNISLLGHRGSDDVDRQNAIILSAYKSPDSDIKAPSIVQYKGINDFNLSNHRLNVIAANGNYFTGEFHISTGQNLQDLINSQKVNVFYAYSTSKDGSQNFSTTEFADATYIGTYIGSETSQPTDYKKYSWIAKSQQLPIYTIQAVSSNRDIEDANPSYTSYLSYNGANQVQYYNRGLNCFFLSGTTAPKIDSIKYFDTYETPSLATDLATYISNDTSNDVLVIIGYDAISVNNDLLNALKAYGYGGDNSLYTIEADRTSFVFIGQKGMQPGSAYYKMSKNDLVSIKAIICNGIPIGTGHTGDDGLVYKLNPIIEEATVILDNGTKKIKRQLYYQINKYTNNVPTIITDGTITGYWGKSEMSFTRDSLTYKVDDVISYTKDVQSIKVNLIENGNVVDSRSVPVVFANQAVFDITDDAITQAVQSGKSYTDGQITTVNNKITSVETTANGIKTTVSDNYNTLNGKYNTLNSKVTEIETTANGITTTVSNYMQPNKNYYGFCKNIHWNTMGVSTIPLISTYGVEVLSSDRAFGRISNLGFYGEGGYFVVSGTIRMTKANNNNINLNLCDEQPYKIEFNSITGNCLNVTTNSQKFVCYYNITDNSYTDVDTYNGFFDIEGVVKDSGNHCIIENLKIERGVQPTKFCIADEDNNNVPIVLKKYGDWTANAVTKDNNTKEYTPNNKPEKEEGSYIDYVYFDDITVKNHQCYTLTFDAYTDTNDVVILSYLYGNGGIINSDSVYRTYSDGYTETTLTTSQLNNGFKKYYIHWFVSIDGIKDATLVKNCIPVRLVYSETNNKANLKFRNITLYEGYVSDSVIQQTRSQIEQTAESITSTISNTGDNLLAGVGNGLYWTGYTSFDINGFTFNFNSSNYLVSPVFQDYSGTYTLSFSWVSSAVKVEIFEFTTLYNLGDNPDFSTGNKIAEISTNDVDNYVPTKMHRDNTLGRYYYTFSESTGSSKTFRIRFSTTESNTSIQKIQVEAGSIPHAFNEAYASNQSQIKQTADSIELKVNEVSVKLSDGIELNGNTKVNGSVNINDDNTGFILTGSSGSTQISPKSIGSYNEFSNKSENNIISTGSSISYGSRNGTSYQASFSWSFTTNLGTVPSGKVVTFSIASISFMKPNSGTILSGSNITFKVLIKENDSIKYSNTVSTSTMNISNSITSSGGNFTVYYYVRASFSLGDWSTSETPYAQCNGVIQWSYATNNFQLIGYDGYAVNFGNNGVAYIGSDDSVFKYGNYGIRVNNSGVHRYVTNSISSIIQKHIHGGTTYTDTIRSHYVQEWCPLNGYAIRQTDSISGGDIYIDAKDDVIEVLNQQGTVNVFLGAPTYFTGKRVLLKKVIRGGDMDVYAGYSTDQTSYIIVKGFGSVNDRLYNRTDDDLACKAYFSDGIHWIEEWLAW